MSNASPTSANDPAHGPEGATAGVQALPSDAALPASAALRAVLENIDALVIGASAGGVEALSRILPALPARFSPVVIIVLHLPADANSELPTLFAPRCALPVRELSDREPLIGGTVYFAPAGYHSLVNVDRRCALSIDEAVHFSRPSIDVLFESAAWTYGARLLAMLLTGASADGANGMATVRAEGGHNWAQDPHEARASTMPLAAIQLGVVDHVLSIDAIIAALANTAVASSATTFSSSASTTPSPAPSDISSARVSAYAASNAPSGSTPSSEAST